MRIIVNDIAASEGGALSVLRDFYEAVKKYDKENEYVFVLSAPYVEETDRIKVVIRSDVKKCHLNKLLFDFFTGKKFMNGLHGDIIFSLQNIVTFGMKIPQIVYVHQSIPYQDNKKFSFIKKAERKYALIQYGIGIIINKSIKKASKVIVQTNWMKDAIIQKTGIDKNCVYVISPTINVQYEGEKNKVFDKTKFFYPTSNFLYKNNELIYEAMKTLKKEKIDNVCMEMTLEKSENNIVTINKVGRLSRNEVMDKYRESTLVFPSYIETFGMPLAEAKKAGTIILAADCNYAREVLAGYENAYFFDYKSSKELAELMRCVITGQIEKKEVLYEEDQKDGWKEIIEIIRQK